MKNKHNTTLKDIANHLDLSISTISRALHDHPAIKQETRELVKATAKRLDYYPDTTARNLQKRSTNTIGVIVPEIRHFFFSSAIDGIEDIAYQAGYTIFVAKSNEDYGREVLNTRSLVSNRVAGLIVSVAQTTKNGDHLTALKRRNIPVVLFDRVLDDVEACKVVVDDYKGAYDSTTHLIESGYKKIAHLAGPSHLKISMERLKGYRAALRDAGYKFKEELVVHVELDELHGTTGTKKLLALPQVPDAIFAVNDPVAIGAHKEISSRGMKIPDEIAISGFSNNPSTEIVNPPLTTVDQHGYKMGQVAAQLLIEQIEQGAISQHPRTEVVIGELIIRGSSRKS
ncbi:MAG: LacI family DNA-binding transcriptional regulator [Candidatus Marinimicrobia bacterium]|nr:LacI family DNA-binding transcriptional regulator [Candidatus Neomarinimicrobiota bacterium]MBT4361161.1 LacI family DNA-binding transcriptional regulator [Candidatus Neomarinimicrobiota bacterium]MBT4715195.1 LacI family DNA-binding transcriptional regulator [Candidatus Neomarinimicrobiota bacterium]MBT4947369.1 LacI family DNA-binding transcriptional regulator [Candidatus Neomarinimicrobiota bacterium]MBT5271442.1 LacI family DNA-binding transcriptional regulator [Candidatus Neomarinimicro